jgi:ABC-type transport system substrate-binding protein
VLRRWLGVSGHGPEARTRLELRAQLAALFDDGDADRLYPLLATIMGLTLEPDVAARLRSVSREAVQEHTFVAVCELLQKLSDERPACLMLEDLHWADDATLELVERLLDTTEEASVGIMLLYRAEREHPSWHLGETARQRYPHRYREIELRPLGQKASRELALDRAGAELPDGVVKQLAERSGGNPFFLEAALRDLQESGALRLEDGRWMLADGDVSIPAQVRSVLQARLDRLGPDTREVIQLGAVIGRSFDLDLLRALLPGRPLTRALAELQRLDLIVEEARRPSPTYRFRHGLVQEVAYGTLVEARRKELHGKVGAALEETCGREGETLAALARHFSEADDAPRAAKYLLAAGDAARSVAADRDALHNYRLARRFLARLGDDQRMRETLFKIALVHHLAFDYAGAEEAYDAAFCCRVEDEKPGPPPTEHLHLSCSRPEGIVPGHVYSSDGASFVFSLFRGLLRVEEDMSVMPELAENFRVSSDGLTYLFQLRDGLRWSDGEPLTAEDFVYTWQCMREQQLVTSFFLEDVASAEALDDVTLEVQLHEPRNAFLYLLASPWSFPWPKHRVEADPEGWSAPEQLVGNGPFALAEWDDKHAVLRANPMWLLPRGNVVEIDASFHDTEMQVALWQEGEFDVAPGWHGDIDIEPEQIHETAPYSTRFIGMRVDGPLGDSRLRRAIAQAINRSTLFRQLRRTPSSRHGGAIPPGVPGHSPNIAPHHDLDEARRLLAEAGYPDGEGLRELVLEHNESYRESVDELARQLGEIGIRVVARRRGRRGFDPERPTPEADLWAEGWSADFPDPDGFFRGLIDWRFRPVVERVPEITRVFERARSLTQHDERLKLYQQVDRMLVSELVVLVPLAYPRSTYLVRPWVHGIEITPITLGQFDRVVIDGEARDRAGRDRSEEGEPAAAP